MNLLKLIFYLYLLCFILNVISGIIILSFVIPELLISEIYVVIVFNLATTFSYPILAEKAYKKEIRVPYPQNLSFSQPYTGSFICSILNFFSFFILLFYNIRFGQNLMSLIVAYLFLISGLIAFFCSIILFIYYRREKATIDF